ncbi:DEAD/DEAH box helicase [Gryllotalpicola kribbensis]|uniref:DEAD/DEAH box helicase n=1 Tax=Gryllotalpicola kribbensis TaxID=993084 RepID=A0ABP8ALG9_9MICO
MLPDATSPTSIYDLLDEYARLAPDQRSKGSQFERLIKAFLLSDPTYADQYADVWLWSEWPGRDGKPDTGIDLVAERRDGGFTAIQCKFYDPAHTLQKADIDSFFTASGKAGFNERLIFSTTDKWSANAEDALTGQQIPTYRIGVADLAESRIDWSEYSFSHPDEVQLKPQKRLRPHQREALEAVREGFANRDRGKLVMACGTGKTYTSLKIAEDQVPLGGTVLFLVPSIALLSQTLREWTAEQSVPIRAFAVCSDSKVGKKLEDFSVSDLSFPATTDTASLVKAYAKGDHQDELTVVFSTYQSIGVVADAQKAGLPEFDLVICDEAHRTTGVTLAKDAGSESAFVRVHDGDFIKAKKRLYMTATPKIFGNAVKTKAAESSAVLASMDDESLYGPEFHRLGFGEAVERGLLTDYRVLVLAIDENTIGENFQQEFAHDGEITIPDAARIVGIYNGLAKRGVAGLGEDEENLLPLKRAVAFSRSIADSKRVMSMLDGYAGGSRLTSAQPAFSTAAEVGEASVALEGDASPLTLYSDHVDGSMNVLERNAKLEWLKAETGDDAECRILTNARCLSEGVDVPALDAVIFLNSRDSQVDVVQSVGRVMRRAEGKDFGYIILPIAVPAGVKPEQALNDNAKYKVVWDVLRALRAHDERFEAKIESLDLGRNRDPQVQVIGYGDFKPQTDAGGDSDGPQPTLDFAQLGAEWRDAIYAKIVEKVGERDYWIRWTKNVAEIAARQQARIRNLLDADENVRLEFEAFVKGLQDNLNPSVTDKQAIEMLAQHIVTQPIFDALFEGHEFSKRNPVARIMTMMVGTLEEANVGTETNELDRFYDWVRNTISGITDPAGKQTIIKRLYQDFFTVAFSSTSERDGIVYTPNEIVDFILHSADQVLRSEFGQSLGDPGVGILDPFTGTGTFIVNLLRSGLIEPDALKRKYEGQEIWANEINLLAYYVAAANIEETYLDVVGGEYTPFPGMVLTDTFQSSEENDQMDTHGVFSLNNERVAKQWASDLTVIVGNPPYSSGQGSGNDANQNLKYRSLDIRIENTFAEGSSATSKRTLYDSYLRALRWASDRIEDRGVVGFVTNNGYLDDNSAEGVRRALQAEFSSLNIINLRGSSRTAAKAKADGGNVFGIRAGVAIAILVKNPRRQGIGEIRYWAPQDFATAQEKLSTLDSAAGLSALDMAPLVPNEHGDWLGTRNENFALYTPLGDKTDRSASIFKSYTLGLATGRDAWAYNFSRRANQANIERFVDAFNAEVGAYEQEGSSLSLKELEQFVDTDPSRISWNRNAFRDLERKRRYAVTESAFRSASHRPFTRMSAYFDRDANAMTYRLPSVFPTSATHTPGIVVSTPRPGTAFATLAVADLPDLSYFTYTAQFFPRYTYRAVENSGLDIFGEQDDSGYERIDNVTDEILDEYRKLYGASVTKDSIFDFVYGFLHSPDYRERYAADLKKMLPRIPKLQNAEDFWTFSRAGAELAKLHLGYESVEPYPLTEHVSGERELRVEKMKYAGKPGKWDKSTVIYNEHITLSGIPLEAQEYMLGSRSALDWIIERYRVRVDKASGIRNDPNDWGLEHGDPEYILNLVKRIVTVSLETVRIVASLPPLAIREEQ